MIWDLVVTPKEACYTEEIIGERAHDTRQKALKAELRERDFCFSTVLKTQNES